MLESQKFRLLYCACAVWRHVWSVAR